MNLKNMRFAEATIVMCLKSSIFPSDFGNCPGFGGGGGGLHIYIYIYMNIYVCGVQNSSPESGVPLGQGKPKERPPKRVLATHHTHTHTHVVQGNGSSRAIARSQTGAHVVAFSVDFAERRIHDLLALAVSRFPPDAKPR